MKKRTIFQKVLTVGLVSAIGFSTLLASGAEPVQAQSATSTAVSKGTQVVNYGKNFLGTPYKFGASTSTTRVFDCSSFTKYVFKNTASLCRALPLHKLK
ncbi:hypothetical protein HMSSN139_42570 [Paenibacillus sp. HMSSN-139]|nr:hypothetical protein HMSSN139_42570 [Paenibacillus sp. HMSSN-139]